MAVPQHRTVQAFPANSIAITQIDNAVIRGVVGPSDACKVSTVPKCVNVNVGNRHGVSRHPTHVL
jgi:hypothetical protein